MHTVVQAQRRTNGHYDSSDCTAILKAEGSVACQTPECIAPCRANHNAMDVLW